MSVELRVKSLELKVESLVCRDVDSSRLNKNHVDSSRLNKNHVDSSRLYVISRDAPWHVSGN